MQQANRFAVIILALVVGAVLIAGSASAADKKTSIQLELKLDINGITAIKVLPRDAKIWRNKPDKPKKVNWWVVNNSPYDDLFWELRYDPTKGGGSADYFGDIDIECDQAEITVQPDKKPDFPNAEWPYSVTVYACVGGAKAQKLATADPRIIWKD